MRIIKCGIAVNVVFACAISGCGRDTTSGPATVPAGGLVTLHGKPVEGAIVVFSPELGSEDGRLASQAITDKDGQYKLTTHIKGGKDKQGIMPGKYAVSITKVDASAVKDMTAPPKNVLPRKYGDPKTSQLKAEVAAGKENNFEFPLRDQ